MNHKVFCYDTISIVRKESQESEFYSRNSLCKSWRAWESESQKQVDDEIEIDECCKPRRRLTCHHDM